MTPVCGSSSDRRRCEGTGEGYGHVITRNHKLHLDSRRARQHPARADRQPIQRTSSPWANAGRHGHRQPCTARSARSWSIRAANATKPFSNLVRARIDRLVDWNIRTLVPRRTTTRRTRRGLDSSCTASCSITSMVSPTAVGPLISTTVTADEGLPVAGLVDGGKIFMVCGISIDGSTCPAIHCSHHSPCFAVGGDKPGSHEDAECTAGSDSRNSGNHACVWAIC